MDEIAYFMDWDLEAIVRGSTSESAPSATTIMEDPYLNFSQFCSEQNEIVWSFPEFSETTKVLDELQDLYKPFYPVLHPLSTQTILTSNSLPIPKEPQEFKVHKASEEITPHDQLQIPIVSKSKKSKKNKVMKQVTTENGTCDSWAWRKYGQKPIKGSPYPRSYYKCSTSKGCLARKQVERSHLDPQVFLVTYTAEHSHPHLAPRNSLASRTRKNNNSIVASQNTLDQKSTCSSSSSAMILSQNTPLDEVEMVTSVEQSKGLMKEEEFLELLDEAELGHGWFSSTELEELIGDLTENLN
ncbi:hypothetical protein TanjilG_32100 [Lupinus angustifolius]|uniref:WRKY domain-containing protein n=1 Tax=Lupinus angustifolius TaxID=3871 RepID=A0A4P1RF92_LUPAN|nr:PREDICTED: probable WRKY transcription factor 29 [Lupinus angustifolius]OIW09951.1 hypothetical protein TanjilG_32100 [Lupinus angustifolius]